MQLRLGHAHVERGVRTLHSMAEVRVENLNPSRCVHGQREGAVAGEGQEMRERWRVRTREREPEVPYVLGCRDDTGGKYKGSCGTHCKAAAERCP